MTRDELMAALAGMRRAPVKGRRAPHKPLLVLWLLGRYVGTGSTTVTYDEADVPVSRLIGDFGPPARTRQRAAMPFVHLERRLWDLRDARGEPIPPTAPESGAALRRSGAVGRLRPEAERLLAERGTLAAAARLLLDQHFTHALEGPVCEAAGLDLSALELEAAAQLLPGQRTRRSRRSGFAEEVLRAYAYSCAMCGYDGALGRHPVGLEAAHVRWHSQDGPDTLDNALALCALHHALFDLGVLGLTEDLRVRVSGLYTARSEAGRAVDVLQDRPLALPRPGLPRTAESFVRWHTAQVFKHTAAPAA
ncbi:phosphorothioated DNA-binding restriction endonuclease [Streptomyces sp. NPDC001380]|uniref:phosphorothioated DNA-binding restriction endonuclease n=1 Tax=Streptomyces sp. NPDC001380 TaxID=3364566 RepID=UPI003674B2D2